MLRLSQQDTSGRIKADCRIPNSLAPEDVAQRVGVEAKQDQRNKPGLEAFAAAKY
jgi:hypothetical protein